MKKIVHIINAMEVGGVEVGVLSLLKSPLSYNYHVVLVKHCDKKIYNALNEDQKSRLHISNGYLSAFNIARKLKPKFIVSSLWRGHFVSLLVRVVMPTVSRIHFVHSTRFGHVVDRIITKLSIFFSDIIFCDSEMTKNWISGYNNNLSIYVVGMNVSFSSEKRKFIQNDVFDFVFIGRFSEQKRIEKSILFINELVSLGCDVHFDLYGRDDGTLIKLNELVESLSLANVVVFHDPIMPDSVELKLRGYKFYLQTSSVEGMAISVFQSIKNGLLPVVTPVGEIPNYSENKKNAFYVDVNNIKESAFVFSKMINNKEFDPDFVGNIINPEKYPKFDDVFFNTIREFK